MNFRTPAKITATFFGSRIDRVVPLGMELVAANVESFHLGVADFDAFVVGSSVERTLDAQPGFGCCGGDEFDHGHSADKRAGAPVLRDVAEKAVLDPVPLRYARRIVADMDGETYLIGKLLKFYPPQPTRAPFEPPQSAVIVNSRASG